MSGYQRYPLTMIHPHYRPAVVGTIGVMVGDAEVQAKPAYMPPVTVSNLDDEHRHRAMGYETPGVPDPEAYEDAVTDWVDPHEVQEYPKWVDGVLCNTMADELALLEAKEAAEREALASKPRRKNRDEILANVREIGEAVIARMP